MTKFWSTLDTSVVVSNSLGYNLGRHKIHSALVSRFISILRQCLKSFSMVHTPFLYPRVIHIFIGAHKMLKSVYLEVSGKLRVLELA